MAQNYYSPSNQGFYNSAVHPDLPEDALPISVSEYGDLLGALNSGKVVVVTDGVFTIGEPPPAIAPAPIMSRETFCVALIGAGILSEAEAIEAALGAWPAKFEPALDGKPLIEKLTAKNLWRETKTVARDAPLFVDLLTYYVGLNKLSAAQAKALGDSIFAG